MRSLQWLAEMPVIFVEFWKGSSILVLVFITSTKDAAKTSACVFMKKTIKGKRISFIYFCPPLTIICKLPSHLRFPTSANAEKTGTCVCTHARACVCVHLQKLHGYGPRCCMRTRALIVLGPDLQSPCSSRCVVVLLSDLATGGLGPLPRPFVTTPPESEKGVSAGPKCGISLVSIPEGPRTQGHFHGKNHATKQTTDLPYSYHALEKRRRRRRIFTCPISLLWLRWAASASTANETPRGSH